MNKQTENEKLYNSLIDGYAKAFPKKTGKQVQLDVSNLWKQIKKSDDLVDSVNKKLCEWKEKEMKMKGNLFSFWSKVGKHYRSINSSKHIQQNKYIFIIRKI